MEYIFNTRLRGNIALTDSYHTNLALQKDNTLYKFIWVQSGSLQLEIDHVPTTLMKGEIIPLTPLHHIEFKAINGEYLTLLFNSNFYCIFGHDNEDDARKRAKQCCLVKRMIDEYYPEAVWSPRGSLL